MVNGPDKVVNINSAEEDEGNSNRADAFGDELGKERVLGLGLGLLKISPELSSSSPRILRNQLGNGRISDRRRNNFALTFKRQL